MKKWKTKYFNEILNGKNAFLGTRIKEILIPPSVTKICEKAFHSCLGLKKVDIPKNSNLQIIGKDAFSNTGINEIFIPPSVTKICINAFESCKLLKKVEIPTDSNLQIIEECAFAETNIEEIYLPKNMIELKDGCFNDTKKLTKILISPSNNQFIFKDDKYLLGKSNINNDKFDVFLFIRRDIEEISLPSNLLIIESFSFLN